MTRTAIAFDFGTKRIGVAAANIDAQNIASAACELSTIAAREGIPNAEELKRLFDEWQPEVVIVGLPKQSDGSDMEITRRARKFGNRIRATFKYDVCFVDETLTTKEAKREADTRGHRGPYSQSPVDSIAARLILESWFNERAQGSAN